MNVLIVAFLLATGSSEGVWYADYERGVRRIEQGQAAAALPLLESALAAHQKEALHVPTRPQQYTDYLPHLYLAIAHQMTGNIDKARNHLALAETSGVAAKSEVGRPLLIAYQLLLRGDTNVRYARPPFATYSDKPPLLTDADFKTLRNDVLMRYDLPADTNLRNAPWYANYELGLELERKGDYPRALAHFIDAVASRPDPKRQARMYGMWLIDYYPYFHIARSHSRLENWEGARNALEISQRIGELPRGSPEMNESVSLLREAQSHLASRK